MGEFSELSHNHRSVLDHLRRVAQPPAPCSAGCPSCWRYSHLRAPPCSFLSTASIAWQHPSISALSNHSLLFGTLSLFGQQRHTLTQLPEHKSATGLYVQYGSKPQKCLLERIARRYTQSDMRSPHCYVAMYAPEEMVVTKYEPDSPNRLSATGKNSR